MTGMLALALTFGIGLAACGGKKADAPAGGAADIAQTAGDAKKAVSGALSALKKGDAAALAAAIKGKTAAELASLFTSEFVPPGGDFEYELNEAGDGIVLTKYTGEKSVLVIPQTVEGYPVVQVGALEYEIGEGLIRQTKVSALIIPEGVKIIGVVTGGYMGKSLETVVFPSTLTEITYLEDEKLTNVDLSHCVNLTKINIIGGGFTSLDLSACIKLTEINKIGGGNLQSVKLPDSAKIIDKWAFSGCEKLTDINIPANIEIIGEDAFKGCPELYNLTIPESITAIKFLTWGWDGDRKSEWRENASGDPIQVFQGCGKLPIATRKRLQNLGYKGEF